MTMRGSKVILERLEGDSVGQAGRAQKRFSCAEHVEAEIQLPPSAALGLSARNQEDLSNSLTCTLSISPSHRQRFRCRLER